MTKVNPCNFKPPKDSSVLISLAKLLLPLLIKYKYGDLQLKIVDNGLERFKALKNVRTIICPNHPSPADIEVVSLFSKLVGEELNFLTARELFHARPGRINLLEYLGCYSVARGTTDFSAYRTTRNLIVSGKKKLVIFPEGEVSYQADSLLPLKAGAIYMAFAALLKLRTIDKSAPVMILPVALKYSYKSNIRKNLEKTVRFLEHSLHIKTNRKSTLLQRIRFLSERFITQYEKEYNCSSTENTSLNNRVQNLRKTILNEVAKALGCELPKNYSLLDQIHFLQSVIYDLRWRKKEYARFFLKHTSSASQSKLKKWAKDLHHAVNIMGIYQESFAEPVAQEKMAALVEVMELDMFKHVSPKGPLLIHCDIGDALNLADYYDEFLADRSSTVDKVNNLLAARLFQQIGKLESYAPHIYV